MKLLDISSKSGNGMIEGIATLNHSISKVLGMIKSIKERNDSDPLNATLFVSGEDIGKYDIVVLPFYTHPNLNEGSEEGIIIGKIYLEGEGRKAEYEIELDVKKEETKFKAKVINHQKKPG